MARAMPQLVRKSDKAIEAGSPESAAAPAACGQQSPRLFFLHIMKTAGTTLCSYLEQQYSMDRFPPHKAGALLKSAANEAGIRKKDIDARTIFDQYDYLCAHTNFLAVLPPDFKFITVLREPEARLRSLFRHWQQFTDEELRRSPASDEVNELKRAARQHSLEDFLALDKRSIFRNFDNGMTRTLVENFPIARENMLSDTELVSEAKRTIDRAWCMGVTEQFDRFLELLCYRAGWPVVPSLAELNVRRAARSSSDLRETQLPGSIESAIRLDREVYAYATRVFADQYDAMAAELLRDEVQESNDCAAELRQRIDERSQQLLVHHADQVARPRELVIDMAGALRGGGWLDRESLEDGRVYRWTGPETRSFVDVVLSAGSDCEIRVIVVGMPEHSMARDTRLVANGMQLSTRCETGAVASRVLRGLVPRRFRTSSRRIGRVLRALTPDMTIRGWMPASTIRTDGFVRLEIFVPRTLAPSEIDQTSSDRRTRGLAIQSIRIVQLHESDAQGGA